MEFDTEAKKVRNASPIDYSTGSEKQNESRRVPSFIPSGYKSSASKIPRISPTTRRVEKLNYRVDDMLSLLRQKTSGKGSFLKRLKVFVRVKYDPRFGN